MHAPASPQTTATRPTLAQCRERASFLLKDLRSGEPARALRAAARLRGVPTFAPLEPERIVGFAGEVRRKHALAAVAAEQGFASWTALKAALDLTVPILVPERLFGGMAGAFLNRWYRRYDEARAALLEGGGVLLPYHHQFAVCRVELLALLGADPTDPDWARIGWDWVQPADAAAHRRLAWKLEALGYAASSEVPHADADLGRQGPADAATAAAPATAARITALGRTVLLVRDHDEALRFYRDALGFVPLHDQTTPDGQRFLHVGPPGQVDGPPVGLWFLTPCRGDEALVGRQAGGQPLLVVYTDDCGEAAARLQALGVRFKRPPAVQGGSVFAQFLDLYGNEIVLVELQDQ